MVLVEDVPELLEGEDPSDFEGAPPADRSREARAHRRAWTAWVEAQCKVWWDAYLTKQSPRQGDTLRRIRGAERQEWGELSATGNLSLVQAWRKMEVKGLGVVCEDEDGGLVWVPAEVDEAGNEVAEGNRGQRSLMRLGMSLWVWLRVWLRDRRQGTAMMR